MPAETSPAETSERVPSPAAGGPAAASSARVACGERWRGIYQVIDSFGELKGRWFSALNLGTGQDVWLRVGSLSVARHRARLFERLVTLECPHLQRPLEAHGDAAERVEIWQPAGALTLRSWRAGRAAPGPAEMKNFVRQLSAALSALHAGGIGHFSLSPDTIYVRSGPGEPEFVLGGFDAVETFQQDELVPITVDPLYAPPEAAGLFKHSPGEVLSAWDWWSLGRVLQELFLGQPVVMRLPDDVAAKLPRDLAPKAEALLFERETGLLRAGAVELMTALDKRTDLLLRGLLTGPREGRWAGVDVQEWLAGGTPKERYDHPIHERFFRLDGRGYTVPEAARRLSDPEHFAQAVTQVFEAGKPGTLAHFLRNVRNHDALLDRLEQATQLMQAVGFKALPEELGREVAAAVALQALSGGEFFWRGQPVAALMRHRVETVAEIDAVSREMRALGTAVVVQLLNAHDPAAAQFIAETVKGATEAEALVAQKGWNKSGSKDEWTALWRLAMEAEARLLAARQTLMDAYACTADVALEKIFKAPHPTRGVLVVLAWTARHPERFGYVTHAEVRRKRLAALAEEGRALARVLFWRRLGRALRAGPLLFSPRWKLTAAWLTIVLLLAVHVPGPAGVALGLVPVIALLLLRLGAWRWQMRLVGHWAGDVQPWTWRDSAGRCDAEGARLADQRGLPATRVGVVAGLQRIDREIKELRGPEAAAPVAWPPLHLATWGATLASWLAVALLSVGSVWRGIEHPPVWTAHLTSWQHLFSPSKEKEEKPEDPKDVKISWPYKLPLDVPFEITVQGAFTPTGKQTEAAVARGRQLVAPYKPETINAYVAIYVPIADGQGGLLLFIGNKGVMMGHNGVLINFVPMAKMWLQIGDQRAIFIEK